MAKKHVDKILNALGEANVIAQTGLTERTIEHAKYAGRFSGLWFGPLEAMCDENGVACPREAFYFKEAPKKVGDDPADIQPRPSQKKQGGKTRARQEATS